LVYGILATRMILEEFQDVVISEIFQNDSKPARYSAVVRMLATAGDKLSH